MRTVSNFYSFEKLFKKLNVNKFLKTKLKKQFFEIIPNLFNYEEEGEKLSFDIVFIKNIEQQKRQLPQYLFQKISLSNTKDLNLHKSIKSIAPFSLNGWNIFISINENNYEFGIYKNLGGVDSLELEDVLSSNDFIQIEKMDKNQLVFKNGNHDFILHISVLKQALETNRKKQIKNLVIKFTSQIEHEHKTKFIKNISNSLFHNMNKLHGTILLVQDANERVDCFISKGILFDNPINLFEEYLNYILNCSQDDNIAERYYSLIGILSLVLNIDGITLINSKGQLLGYNIFIDNKKVDTSKVVGGARKRAAYSIENSNINGLLGIYFQSHDGDNYFKELR